MDELKIYKTAFTEIKDALKNWALTEGNEKDGIWFVAGIVEVTQEILKDVKST